MTKPGELLNIALWMNSALFINMKKSDMHAHLTRADTLLTEILTEQNFTDEDNNMLHIKSGKALIDELHDPSETLNIGHMSLIADAALRNLNERIKTDFGLYLSDEKATSRIKASVKFRHFGDQTYFDMSPGEIAEAEKAFWNHIKELGLQVSMRKSKYNHGEEQPALAYDQNRQILNDYFAQLGASVTYTLDEDYIDQVDLSIPMDKMAIYHKPAPEPEDKPFSETLTEAEAYAVKKDLNDLASVIRMNYAGEEMTFRPIAEPNIILSLMRSYLYTIERVFDQTLPLFIAMEEKLNPIRAENRQALNMQTQKGDKLLQDAQGEIRGLYTILYNKMEQFVKPLGLSITDLFLNRYGSISVHMCQSYLHRKKPIPLETFVLEDCNERQLVDNIQNWETILRHFAQIDPNAFIREATLNQNRGVKNIIVTMTDFQTGHRLQALFPD